MESSISGKVSASFAADHAPTSMVTGFINPSPPSMPMVPVTIGIGPTPSDSRGGSGGGGLVGPGKWEHPGDWEYRGDWERDRRDNFGS